ncbi:MAG: hypothetical protein DME03_07800 [Candidatus Rokuibacteriota bacterium]|nr:MAG: hypothetical protein DME03_07800 [Candidatus Rokubacteria bacterium]
MAMIELWSWPVAARHAARPMRVSPPSTENRSITALVSLTKPDRLSAEIATLPRNDCWLNRMLLRRTLPVLAFWMLIAQRASVAITIVLLRTWLSRAGCAASIW